MELLLLSYASLFLLGYGVDNVMDYCNVYSNRKGVDYYAEVHTTRQNIFVHVVCMPFTIYGMLFWIPAMFMCDVTNAYEVQIGLYIFYLGHYIKIDPLTSFYYTLMYIPGVFFAAHNFVGGMYDFIYGFCMSAGVLALQEYAGHHLGGDPPSRPEGVLNAIFYAMYFSAEHFRNYCEYMITVYNS